MDVLFEFNSLLQAQSVNLEKQTELLSVLKKECRQYDEMQNETDLKTTQLQQALEKSNHRCNGRHTSLLNFNHSILFCSL